jgi:Kef-type K+ transport system membrane component KefB/Trk K+ transport system NAD-binding subunit
MLLATTPEDPTRFVPLLVVLVLAFLVPVLLARLRRIPVVVGEILAGVLVGPSVLGLVTDGPILTFMADIGLAFLMFLAGLEIDFETLFPPRHPGQPAQRAGSGRGVASQAFWVYAVTLALAIPGGFLINWLGLRGDPWLLAFILSATSLGVLLPILKEREMLSEKFGQLVFVTATLADFITVILLTVYIITLDKGLDLEIFSVGLLFLAFLILYRVGPQFTRLPAVRNFVEELSKATVQIKIRGAIAIFMAFVVLAEFLGAELILGAFLAGMIISLIKRPEDDAMVHKLEAFGFGFFIPVFFILVGVDLDLRSLIESPGILLLLPLIFLVSLAVKLIPMALLRNRFTLRELAAGGLLLNTHLSLEIAVAVIGLRSELFDPATSTTVVLFSVITVLLMPLGFGILLPYRPKDRRRFMLVIGASEIAIKVAQELRAHGEWVQFLVDTAADSQTVEQAGFPLLESPALSSGLDQLDVQQLRTVLLLDDDEARNLEAARRVRAWGARNVVAMVREPSLLPRFQELGVRPYTPAVQRVTMITMMARNPDALTLLTSPVAERDIAEIRLRNSGVVGRRLRSLRMPGDMLVLAIRRDGQLLIPRGDTQLAHGDRLTILGQQAELKSIREWLSGWAAEPDLESLSREAVTPQELS